MLPAGTGKTVRVLVIAAGEKASEAEEAGADFVGTEFVQKIKDGWLDFDVLVATPDLMGQLGAARPRARSARSHAEAEGRHGDVRRRPGRPRDQGRKDRVPRRQERQRARRRSARSRSRRKRCETNFAAFMDQIVRSKPAAAKGVYVRTVTVSSTMGPGVRIDTTPYRVTEHDEAEPRRSSSSTSCTTSSRARRRSTTPTSRVST